MGSPGRLTLESVSGVLTRVLSSASPCGFEPRIVKAISKDRVEQTVVLVVAADR